MLVTALKALKQGTPKLVACPKIYSGTTWQDILLFIDVNVLMATVFWQACTEKKYLPGGHGMHLAFKAVLYKKFSR